MSTKPTIALARFADLGGSDVVDPSSGLRDTGFVAGTLISQSFVNALFKQSFLWSQYLNDGALSGNHSIAGTLDLGGKLSVGDLFTFADRTFTADATTNLITMTAHGLTTGDGPFRLTTTGTLPGGLALATDYFWRTVTADTGAFHAARAHANENNNAIDITSAGTGTHTAADTTGTRHSRNAEVFGPLTVRGAITGDSSISIGGGMTSSAVACSGNATVGGTLGVTGALTASGGVSVPTGQSVSLAGTTTLTVGTGATALGGTLAVTGNVTAPAVLTSAVRPLIIGGCEFELDTGTGTRSGNVWSLQTSSSVVASFRLPVGTVISDVVWSLNRNSLVVSSGEFQMDLVRRSFGNGGTTTTTVASELSGTGAASWTTKSLSPDLPHTVLSDFIYLLRLTTSGSFDASPQFDAVKIVVDRI